MQGVAEICLGFNKLMIQQGLIALLDIAKNNSLLRGRFGGHVGYVSRRKMDRLGEVGQSFVVSLVLKQAHALFECSFGLFQVFLGRSATGGSGVAWRAGSEHL